jgi:hypothetical protein
MHGPLSRSTGTAENKRQASGKVFNLGPEKLLLWQVQGCEVET